MNKEERKELMEQLFKENEQKEYNCRNCEYSQDIKHFTSNCKLHYGGVLNSDAKHCMYYTGLDANEDMTLDCAKVEKKKNESKMLSCKQCIFWGLKRKKSIQVKDNKYDIDSYEIVDVCNLKDDMMIDIEENAKHCMYYMTNYMELNDDGSKTEKRYHHHIKYSDDEGKTFTENNGEVIGKYIGTLMDYNEDASNNPSDYKWMPRQWSKRD